MGLLSGLLKKRKKEEPAKAEETKPAKVEAAKKPAKPASAKATAGKQAAAKATATKPVPAKATTDKPVVAQLSAEKVAHKVLVKPLVTEKSAVAQDKTNKYMFVVAKAASKQQISRAIQELYGVKPTKVNTSNIDGRRVRFKKHRGRRIDYKKAVITLPKGKSITVHQGV